LLEQRRQAIVEVSKRDVKYREHIDQARHYFLLAVTHSRLADHILDDCRHVLESFRETVESQVDTPGWTDWSIELCDYRSGPPEDDLSDLDDRGDSLKQLLEDFESLPTDRDPSAPRRWPWLPSYLWTKS